MKWRKDNFAPASLKYWINFHVDILYMTFWNELMIYIYILYQNCLRKGCIMKLGFCLLELTVFWALYLSGCHDSWQCWIRTCVLHSNMQSILGVCWAPDLNFCSLLENYMPLCHCKMYKYKLFSLSALGLSRCDYVIKTAYKQRNFKSNWWYKWKNSFLQQTHQGHHVLFLLWHLAFQYLSCFLLINTVSSLFISLS